MIKAIVLEYGSPNSGDPIKDVELISSHVMKTLKDVYGDDFPDLLAMQVKTSCCLITVTIEGDEPMLKQIEFAKEALLADPQKNVIH